MSNSIITSRIGVPLVAEMESALVILSNGNKQFDKNFTGGAGTTIDVLIPGYGSVNVGADMSSLDMSYVNAKKSVTLVQRGVAASMTQVEQSLALSSFDDQVATPYGIQLANVHERLAAEAILYGADTATVISTGTAGYSNIGDTIATINASYSSGLKFGALSNALASQIQNSGLNFFSPSKSISDSFLNGGIGKFRGADWYESPNIANLNTGTHAVSSISNLRGALNAGGDTLTLTMTSGTLSGTVVAGEIITLVGSKAVDIYGNALANDYAFVVQPSGTNGATVTYTAASDTVALPVKQVYVTGPNKNISNAAMPTSAVLATFQTAANSTYLRGFAWDKQAFIFATAAMKKLAMVESETVMGESLGILMQRGTDVIKGLDIVRWDVLTGFVLARSNWCSSILVKI